MKQNRSDIPEDITAVVKFALAEDIGSGDIVDIILSRIMEDGVELELPIIQLVIYN